MIKSGTGKGLCNERYAARPRRLCAVMGYEYDIKRQSYVISDSWAAGNVPAPSTPGSNARIDGGRANRGGPA